ncbi:MAG: amidohydrolase family protein [Thalassobaculales bacterium]
MAMTPALKAPRGTFDTHMHIYDPQYAFAPTAPFIPPPATVPEYQAMCRRLGIERTLVVQPSGYAFDNRCTLESTRALGPGSRCIVVVPPEVTEEEIAALHAQGARGIRFFMLKGGVLGWDVLPQMAAKMANFGWTVNLQVDGRDFPELVGRIEALPATVVIDHVGKFLEPVPVDHPSFRAMLGLIEKGRTYVKLSAPYEVSKAGPPTYADVGAHARLLARAAPERMLWATNWPHPTPVTASPKPDDAVLLDMLLDWLDDDAARQLALVDNPARLYA